MKRLLITGASGDLGRPLSELAARQADVVGTFLMHPHTGGGQAEQLDLTDRDAVCRLLERTQPDAIIHTALSDRGPSSAIGIAANNLVDAIQNSGGRLIVLSTDMIFDGTAPPYSENAVPSPLSDYGQAKADSEAKFREGLSNCVIVRTSLIYDFVEDNRQISWMLERISAGESVPLFVDEIRSPIYVWNLAEALLELSTGSFTGTLNIAGPEALSRYAYGVHLLDSLGYSSEISVKKVRAAEIAPHRPRNLTLDVTLAISLLKTCLVGLSEAATAHLSATKAT
jgi:dTDP-4-dehydrorhamnose reductase